MRRHALFLGFGLALIAGCGGHSAPTCTPPGASVTHDADVTADETWVSGVHVVPSTIHVRDGAHLTIAACSRVQLAAGASIVVDATATALSADGTAADPVTFVPADASSPWGSLQVTAPATIDLAYTTLQSGGGPPPYTSAPFEGASLVAQGDTTTPPTLLSVDHVTVTGSTGLGIFLQGARFSDASDILVVEKSGFYPVYGGVASAGSLPFGFYTLNAIDQILLQNIGPAAYDDAGPLLVDTTLQPRGVPYRVGLAPSSIVVGSGNAADPPALLTIEASVTILFTPQGAGGHSQLLVNGIMDGAGGQPQGALVVDGTPEQPVIFDSVAATPAPGDWQGLYFAAFVDPRTSVLAGVVADAGADSGTAGVCDNAPGSGADEADCAVDILVATPPPPFMDLTLLRDSAGCGVYRGWSVDNVDFQLENMFQRVPGCAQTNIPDAQNVCPATPCEGNL